MSMVWLAGLLGSPLLLHAAIVRHSRALLLAYCGLVLLLFLLRGRMPALVVGVTALCSLAFGLLSWVDSVTGANVAVNPQPVVGTPPIDVWVQPLRPAGNTTVDRPVTLSVDSSTPLQCDTPASCGSTSIPFSKISWQASNNGGAGDIQNGVFSGASGQPIASFDANATYCSFPIFIFCLGSEYQTNQLNATRMTFTYANDQLYPAGLYRGTVRITASMP